MRRTRLVLILLYSFVCCLAHRLAHGGLSHAEDGADGLMHDTLRIPEGQLIWQPAIIVLPHPGGLEVAAGWDGWLPGFAPDLIGALGGRRIRLCAAVMRIRNT
jgi:hypothetical protein